MVAWRHLRFLACAAALVHAVSSGKYSVSTPQDRQLRTRSLSPPDHVAPDAFSVVAAVRELSDGRVLVADRREKRLVVVQWTPLLITDVGRNGDGPGEYAGASGLVPLGRDSTLLLDGTSRRWLLLDGAAFVRSSPGMSRFAQAFGAHLHGGDVRGRVLAAVGSRYSSEVRIPGSGQVAVETADSVAMLLLDLRTSRADTLLRLRGRYRGTNVVNRTVRGASITYHLANPLATEEQARLFPDGWIAVVHGEPYRVDWLSPERRPLHGPVLPFENIAVDELEKQDAIRRHWGGKAGVEWPSDAFPAWPSRLPAFPNEALFAAPDGRLLVRRIVSARVPNVYYDVIDRAGRLAFRVELAANERIVGSGKRHIYTVATSDDGLESLARHEW